MSKFKKFYESFISLIYPKKCIFCIKLLRDEDYICENCNSSIPQKLYLFPVLKTSENRTTFCFSLYKYEGAVRTSIWRFKFRGFKNYANYFARIMKNGFNILKEKQNQIDIAETTFDFVVPVPLSQKKLNIRGYNQATWLSKSLSKELGIEHKEILLKTRDNSSQRELSLKERKENVKGVYSLAPGMNILGKNIIVCDDVITTGSTLSECAKVLYSSGAKKVFCCTIAFV